MSGLLPLFPLGTVLFPGVPLPLQVFEPRYRKLMQDLMSGPEPWTFGVIAIRQGHEVGADSVRSLYDVGCAAVIRQVDELPDGRFALLLVGDRRFRLVDVDRSRPYLQAAVEYLDEPSSSPAPVELMTTVRERFGNYCGGLGAPAAAGTLPDDPAALSYVIAATMVSNSIE
jgi:Lon protease-like protein